MPKTLMDISFRDLLPQSIKDDPTVVAASSAIDPHIQGVNRDMRLALLYSRLDELDGGALDWLAWQLHVDFWRPELSDAAKRNLVRSSVGWHRIKGTPYAIRRLFADLGVEARIVEWWQPEGAGLAPHTFAVRGVLRQPVLPQESWGEATMLALEDAIAVAKNERSWLAWLALALELEVPLGLVTPEPTEHVRDVTRVLLGFHPLFDRTRLDVCRLDPDTPEQAHYARDGSFAPFRLGRPWSLDTLLAEGAVGATLDVLLPGLEGEWEPPVGSHRIVWAETPLPMRLGLVRERRSSVECLARGGAEVVPTAVDETLFPLADFVGLDGFPGFDELSLDRFPLDGYLEVTHA